MDCEGLTTADFSGIEDAPTQIDEVRLVGPTDALPGFCHLQGYIWPQIGFELKMPQSTWNGKFIQIGCGGTCGTTRNPLWSSWCEEALRRGYSCIVSNQGHDGSGYLWAYHNLQAVFDYGIRAAHVAALAGKHITEQYYGGAPRYSYFMGCSGGGRQALVEAQRFPWDFDGIISIDPAINFVADHMAFYWNFRSMTDDNGEPLFSPAGLDVLHNAVMASCDLDDGVADGVISYPPDCEFDLSSLLCKGGSKSDCLSKAQIDAAERVYRGYVNSDGERVSYPSMPGSEKGGFFNPVRWYKQENLRFFGFFPAHGPDWRGEDFSLDADSKRLDMVSALIAAGNPDLRRFRTAGGRLIMVQGWHDEGTPFPLQTVDYYQTVERTMGGPEATREFARLFMVPGRAHCGRGPGPSAIDLLGYLEKWVERDQAPDVMIGHHIAYEGVWETSDWSIFTEEPDPDEVKFTRPLYPYPIRYRYKGIGDPDDHRNYEAIDPSLIH